jgi:ketosteroid isomerase-like protein
MRPLLCCALLTLSLCCCLPARAATGDEQQLLALEQRWLTAGMERDIPALREILADDFLDVSYQGKLRNKADHLSSTLAPSKSTQTLQELKVRLYGDTGIVTGLDKIVSADGTKTYEVRFTDVFVKRAGRWQAVSGQETLENNP